MRVYVWSMHLDKIQVYSKSIGSDTRLEFQFMVPISGTPIGSIIPIPFFNSGNCGQNFSWIQLLKKRQIGIQIPKFGFPKKNYLGTNYTSFCTRKQGCCHLYIYSKWLPPYLHLLKTVVAIPTPTQNSCRHTHIDSKQLLPYLHLLKTVATIPTSTQNGCRNSYIYSKRLPPSLHLLKTSRCENGKPKKWKAGTFSDSWNWKTRRWERILNQRKRDMNLLEHILQLENEIPTKFLEFKRSGIKIIAKFSGIPSGLPNQDLIHTYRFL